MVLRKLKSAVLSLAVLVATATDAGLGAYLLPAAEPARAKQDAAAPAPPKNDRLKALRKQRVEAAQELYRQRLAEFKYRRDRTSVDFLLDAARRLLDAELAVSETRADRMAALEEHVKRTKLVEQLTDGYVKQGTETPQSVALACCARLDAEIWLEEAKAR